MTSASKIPVGVDAPLGAHREAEPALAGQRWHALFALDHIPEVVR